MIVAHLAMHLLSRATMLPKHTARSRAHTIGTIHARRRVCIWAYHLSAHGLTIGDTSRQSTRAHLMCRLPTLTGGTCAPSSAAGVWDGDMAYRLQTVGASDAGQGATRPSAANQ